MKLQDILYAALFDKAKQTEHVWTPLSPQSNIFSKVYSGFEHQTIGYGFYAFRNKSDRDIEISLIMTKKQNVRYRKNNSNSLVMPIGVGPNEETAVLNIPAGKSQIAIWDIFADASSISFKTKLKTI